MKIVQFGLCYSPNLGDGIIADCLAHALARRRPEARIVQIDISARQSRGSVAIRNRTLMLTLAGHLPPALRQRLAAWRLGRLVDGVEEQWRQAARADLAVVGGGQIFADALLNFPVKLGRVAHLLAEAGTPVAIFGAGVSSGWSARGTALFRGFLRTDLRLVGLRDRGSIAAWTAQIGGGPDPVLTPDPGLLAADCYGPPADRPGGIGLCVTDFGILRHHADGGVAGSATDPVRFYADIAAALVAAGHRVTLFNNGASEDAALMRKVAVAGRARPGAGDTVTQAAPCATPRDLAHRIAGFDAVIAHRLHACIVAHSYGRPVVGLGWDSKLESFFARIGQDHAFTADPDIDGAAVARLAVTALARGIDRDIRARVEGEVWAGIDRLLACVAMAPRAG